MRWNHLGRQLSANKMATDSNIFWAALNSTRRAYFRKAFGLEGSKSFLRFQRDKDGGKVGQGRSYEEDLIPQRQFVLSMLDLYAERMAALRSQVVHAIITGNMDRLAGAIHYNIRMNMEVGITERMDRHGTMQKHREFSLPNRHHGHVFAKTNLESITLDEVRTACEVQWVELASDLRTEYEKNRDKGKEDRQANDAVTASSTDKKGVMKAVQVVNAKQERRRQLASA